MTYSIPGVSDFKNWYQRDFPFSSEAVNATAAVTINSDGQVTAVTPLDRGSGYTSAATVKIIDSNDGPGTGATATSSFANGQITGYSVTAQGSGYIAPIAQVTGGGVDDTNMNYVRDTDVTKALAMAGINFNCALWPTQNQFNIGYLTKAAHFLCVNLKNSNQGIRGRGGEWLRNAFSVGDISSNYQLQESVAKSKILAPLMETSYGCAYLQMVTPKLVANVRSVIGHTKP